MNERNLRACPSLNLETAMLYALLQIPIHKHCSSYDICRIAPSIAASIPSWKLNRDCRYSILYRERLRLFNDSSFWKSFLHKFVLFTENSMIIQYYSIGRHFFIPKKHYKSNNTEGFQKWKYDYIESIGKWIENSINDVSAVPGRPDMACYEKVTIRGA
jgi:hypothetical protein